ncbi:MAG: sugar ABC transporter substrate-binding protein [Parvibaculaceae bacterium]
MIVQPIFLRGRADDRQSRAFPILHAIIQKHRETLAMTRTFLKSFAWPLLLVMLLTTTTALARAEAKKASDIRIVFVTHGEASDTYWSVVKNGVLDGQKAMGSNVEYFAPEVWDVVKMAKLIDTAIASKPDGLVVTIPDMQAIGSRVKKAADAGIPVIVIDTGEAEVPKVGAKFYIGPGPYLESGRQAAKHLRAEGVTHGVCINHEVGNAGNDEACAGFVEGMEGKADILAVTMDPTEVQTRVEAYLSAKPDTNGAFALGPSSAVPTLAALKNRRLTGKVKFGTFNLTPEILKALINGEMSFAIDFQQYLLGYLPVVFLTMNSLYQTMPTANVYTGPSFVTGKEAAQVLELSKVGIR